MHSGGTQESSTNRAVRVEFDRQVGNFVEKGYPQLLSLSEERFRLLLEPLGRRVEATSIDERSAIPFVLVLSRGTIPAAAQVDLVERQGEPGFSVIEADDLARFEPIEQVELPDGLAYLLLDVDTGAATKNVTPNDALEQILGEMRSPLTIEEGTALMAHFPETISKNNGFSMLGSRCGDKRVTAWWLSEGKPKLGWCWAGNPHTWLGSASCGGRSGLTD